MAAERCLVVIGGCGGHANDVLSVIDAINQRSPSFDVVGYLDDNPNANDYRLRSRGIRRLDDGETAARMGALLVMGIGYPLPRSEMARRLLSVLEPAPALIHPLVTASHDVVIANGSVVFEQVAIGPMSVIGDFAMIGRSVVIGHDCLVRGYATLMPGAVLSGGVVVGNGALVGANATVLEDRSVGNWSRVGAGAVLIRDVPDGRTAIGVPAVLQP
jgi:sugar O-acyltransferase (sialic acid O-acetyltransferase NeuD family)